MEPTTTIISAYNEAETIEKEIRNIYDLIVSKIPGSEFIVAEDGSTDGTKKIIKKLEGELGIIHSTSTERKGYAKALKDAFNKAKCPYIFFSDTGNKHDPNDFWQLYKERSPKTLVIGIKNDRKDQWYRKLLTWGYSNALSLYFGVKLHDADSGFRLYSKEIAKKIFNQEWINKDLIASEIVLRTIYLGYNIKEIPVSYKQRKGVSRGLPIKKIPGVIYRVVSNFPKLKKELAKYG